VKPAEQSDLQHKADHSPLNVFIVT